MDKLTKALLCITIFLYLALFMGIYACTHISDQPKKEEFAISKIRDI